MAPMRIAIILNGIALDKKYFIQKVLPALHKAFHTEVFETHSKHDAFHLASKAVDKRFDVIVAAGGDGTLHQVANGILQGRETYPDLPVFGVFPLGTGNDFARTFRIVPNADQLIFLLKTFTPRAIDIGEATFTSETGTEKRFFVNVADIGMGPEVVRRLANSRRPFGSAAAYYMSILATFVTYKPMDVTVTTPEWNWQGKVRSLAIANGKYYGHGLCIAPDAKPDDNIFDAFICGGISVVDFIRYSDELKKDRKVNLPEISYKQTSAVEFTTTSTCAIEADGEWLGWLPAKIKMSPVKLKFLAP